MQPKRGRRASASIILSLVLSLGVLSAHAASSESLLGSWRCQFMGESLSLVFQSESVLVFDGEPARYVLADGVIRVEEDYGVVDYPYTLQGDSLLLQLEEGIPLQCEREGAGSGSRTASGAGKAESPAPSQAKRAPAPAPAASSSSSPALSAGEIGNPAWGFKFRPPQGWKARSDQSGAILGHDTIPGMILVFPHHAASLQDVARQMQEGLVEEGVQLTPAGAIQPRGERMLAGEYAGVVQGERAKGKGIGTLSPHGGGAYILAVSTPEKFSDGIARAAEAIARGIQYIKVDVSDLVRHFAGMWASYSGGSGGGTLSNLTFYPDGSFSDTSETSYSIEYSSDGWQTPDTSLGATGVSSSRARWTVRGTKQAGQIIITAPDGSESVIEYRVFVEKGETYWNEYLFDGRHYSKQKSF